MTKYRDIHFDIDIVKIIMIEYIIYLIACLKKIKKRLNYPLKDI